MLTAKQERFINEYIIDLNASAAALRAGYSPKSAGKIGFQLLENTRIQAGLQKAMKKREKRTEITADRVLAEYAKIAFADIKDFLAYGTVKTQIDFDEEQGKPIFGYKQIVDARPSADIDGTMVNEVSIGKDGTFKFKLHDKKGALDMIGKHLGMFIDKSEITGKDGGPIETSIQTPEERQARINELIAKRGS